MNYADGRKYYGTFKNNMREGQGVLVAQNSKYDGRWHLDRRDGKGVLTDRTGKYAGNFKNDKQFGRGLFTSIIDNSVFEGDWVDGTRHGKGVIKYFDGTLKEQVWKNGLLQGQAIFDQTIGPILPSVSQFMNV